MNFRQRMVATARLWPYMVPLFVVYFAEYAMQSGTWTAIGEQQLLHASTCTASAARCVEYCNTTTTTTTCTLQHRQLKGSAWQLVGCITTACHHCLSPLPVTTVHQLKAHSSCSVNG
jgi:hypothetical protein